MKVFNVISFLLLLHVTGCSDSVKKDKREYAGEKFSANVRTTEARMPEEERLGFKLPQGFEINLFASEPGIGKPINMCFDAKGRMWVTQSFEYPFPSAPGKGKDKLTILEDTDNDGKADLFTTFSDTLNIPIGVLPLNDGAIVYSIPNIYKYDDKNDDGKVDGQKKLFGPFRTNDTHGMINNFVRGYDGWVHSCHGYTNRDTIAGTDGDSISMISGNTFRFRPDGSKVEHTTDGRINPFGLVYDELGYLYSTDCHSSPLYQLIRGGDYMQWGKEEGMGFAPDMKSLSGEATALAGLGYYADVLFPKEYRDNFFVGDAVRCRVYRYSYTFNGSTPVGKKEDDFILSDDPWFRPVDIKLGPDGALYIADFYNSIIGHYEVPLDHPGRDHVRGRIWRITYKGKHNDVNNWTATTIDELLHALNMDNMFVRMTAADQLVDRIGNIASQPVTRLLNSKNISARTYIHSLWVLQRLHTLSSSILQEAISNKNPVIRLHTMRILSEENPNEKLYFPLVLKGLQDADIHVKRATVEALAKYPDMHSLQLALNIHKNIPLYDTHLLYTVRLCLKNILRNDSIMHQAAAAQWTEQDATNLSDVLMGVPSAEAGDFLYKYVNKYPVEGSRAPAIFQHIARFAPYEKLNDVVNIAMKNKNPDTVALLIFKGIQQGLAQRGEKENNQLILWGKTLAEKVLKNYPSERGQHLSTVLLQDFAVNVAGKYKLQSAVPALEAFLQDLSTAALTLPGTNETSDELIALKSSAARSLLKIDPVKGTSAVAKILNDNSPDIYFRNGVGRVLGEFPLGIVNNILKEIKNVPADLQTNIAITLAATPGGKDILFSQVKKGEIFARTLMQPKVQERIMINITPYQKKEFDKLTAGIDPVDKERQTEIYNRVVEFEKAMQSGPPPVDTGKIVFVKNCSPCHSIAEEGGSIGPNLDGVSQWGARALAEKILDPNRNISGNFRNYIIRLKNGKVSAGLYRRDEGSVSVFADLSGNEFSIPKKEIAERVPSKLTLMPDNFRERLSKKDFNALIYFLLNPKGHKISSTN